MTTGLSLTRADRLNRLPFSREHKKMLMGSGVGWALDAMDVGLISFILPALAAQWGLGASEKSMILSLGFVGMAVGASLGGLLADRIGRRQVFALTLLVYGLATGASALVGSVGALMILRFLVGLGLGAELPVASTLVSEFSPTSIRGRIVVILESFWAVGWILSAVIGTFVIPAHASGWRWALVIGMLPAAYALVVRWGMPESVRFLESQGRHTEAEAAVARFEASAGVKSPVQTDIQDAAPVAQHGLLELWKGRLAKRTAALWVAWFAINFAYYGAFLWIPSLLVAQGFSMVRSFEFTLIITLAQLPGYAAAAWLIEVIGRRFTLALFLAGSALSALAFGQAHSEASILIAGCLLSAFNLGAWGALYAITPEIYPTPLRGTGAGQAAAFGRVASMLSPLVVAFVLSLTEEGQNGPLFALFGIAFAVAMVAALLLPEKRGENLED